MRALREQVKTDTYDPLPLCCEYKWKWLDAHTPTYTYTNKSAMLSGNHTSLQHRTCSLFVIQLNTLAHQRVIIIIPAPANYVYGMFRGSICVTASSQQMTC